MGKTRKRNTTAKKKFTPRVSPKNGEVKTDGDGHLKERKRSARKSRGKWSIGYPEGRATGRNQGKGGKTASR